MWRGGAPSAGVVEHGFTGRRAERAITGVVLIMPLRGSVRQDGIASQTPNHEDQTGVLL
jgi:hypothetical protein